jgi:hypothetical protein
MVFHSAFFFRRCDQKEFAMRLVFPIAGQTMRRAVGVKALPKVFAA